jgi:hypothetical protein
VWKQWLQIPRYSYILPPGARIPPIPCMSRIRSASSVRASTGSSRRSCSLTSSWSSHIVSTDCLVWPTDLNLPSLRYPFSRLADRPLFQGGRFPPDYPRQSLPPASTRPHGAASRYWIPCAPCAGGSNENQWCPCMCPNSHTLYGKWESSHCTGMRILKWTPKGRLQDDCRMVRVMRHFASRRKDVASRVLASPQTVPAHRMASQGSRAVLSSLWRALSGPVLARFRCAGKERTRGAFGGGLWETRWWAGGVWHWIAGSDLGC